MCDPIVAQHVTNALYNERLHQFDRGHRRRVDRAERTNHANARAAGFIRRLLGGWPRGTHEVRDTAEAPSAAG